jgi:hypothetical protein
MLPVGLIKELIDRSCIAWLAEVEVGDGGGPGIDVGRQEAGTADQRIDQCALAGLDLSDDRDAAGVAFALLHEVFKSGRGIAVEHRPYLVRQQKSGGGNFGQLVTNGLSNVCFCARLPGTTGSANFPTASNE